MFDALPSPVSFPKLEEDVLEFWRASKIYEASLARRQFGISEREVLQSDPPASRQPQVQQIAHAAPEPERQRHRHPTGRLGQRRRR